MSKVWNEAALQRYIDDAVEESLTLDYKAADALGRADGKKNEITKDVSAMANADGGVLIYGLKEHPTAKHVVGMLDPINRTQFSKEWLDQIINNIRPYIETVIVHPVSLSSGLNDVAYVVEIPKSHTAHQSTNLRYYRRHNFESVPMEDYEIRDVMNRMAAPNVSVRFETRFSMSAGSLRYYVLQPLIKNSGSQVIRDFKLAVKLPGTILYSAAVTYPRPNVSFGSDSNKDYFATYQSTAVLFPEEERCIGDEMAWHSIHNDIAQQFKTASNSDGLELSWTLYADNMVPKLGAYAIRHLHQF